MLTLGDIVQPDAKHIKDAAVLLDKGLHSLGYVSSYTPTRSAIDIFKRLAAAVLPNAPKETRAINCFGPYGSGKSHLGVVIGRMLRDGTGGEEYCDLMRKLENLNEAKLAQSLRNTFLDAEDRDAEPYFLISLYRSSQHSIGHQLLEALYTALRDDRRLSDTQILGKTVYDAAYQRFQEIAERTPDYRDAELSRWNLAKGYFTTKEMADDLKNHDPSAYDIFLDWYREVCHGEHFDPARHGGKQFIEAYLEAGRNLVQHRYAGIAVIWDEFGHVLEDMIGNGRRNAISEIMELQEFVEKACAPDKGHTLFVSLTHVSLAEYGTRMDAPQSVKDRLKTIEGRFLPMRVELKASEAEGYHLLGAQLRWTEAGESYRARSQEALQNIQSICAKLPLFRRLAAELPSIISHCYPLHPITAAGLFAISTFRYAQATRTAFTFFRDLQADGVFSRPVDVEAGLFGAELLRLPTLVEYFQESLRQQSEADWEAYRRALAEVRAKGEESPERDSLLAVLLLSKLLGENFQATEAFIAAALYDSLPLPESELHGQLNQLKNTGLIWKNDATEVWTLAGESVAETESLIEKKLADYTRKPVEALLNDSPDMRGDLFPHLGVHDLEPSPCGIVRSYEVGLLTPSNPPGRLRPMSASYVASLFLVLATDEAIVAQFKAWIVGQNPGPVYFWLPRQGIGHSGLQGKLLRYQAISALLAEESSGEGLKRQLQAKWDKNRQELTEILGTLYGRKGLEESKADIFQSGEPNPLSCRSWHQFRANLEQKVSQAYGKEIHVRNMNLNKVRDEGYLGKKILTDIIQKILDFEDNPAYQNDLLGEKDTSEPAAIIDGIFMANQLFIQRAQGWDIRNFEETTGNLREVLELIHDTFVKRRASPYHVSELRKTLMAPPYGLPPVALGILAAVALRREQKRIVWLGKARHRPFAENLSNAFAADSRYEVQLEDFSPEQRAMLNLLGLALPGSFRVAEPKQAAANLSAFLKTVPPSVKTSPKLGESARKLVEFMAPGERTAHAVADFLCQQSPLTQELPNAKYSHECTETKNYLVALFESFERAKSAKYVELEKEVKILLDGEFSGLDRALVLENLEMDKSPMARAVHRLLQPNGLNRDTLDALTQAAVGRTIEECDDKAIGGLLVRLRQTLLRHKDSRAGENRAAVREALAKALVGVDKAVLLDNLENEQSGQALALASLLRDDRQTDDSTLDAFIENQIGKTVRRCGLHEIQGLCNDLKDLIRQHRHEKPKPEELRRKRLASSLANLQRDFAWKPVLAEWRRVEAGAKPDAVAAALQSPSIDELDALTLAFSGQSVIDCTDKTIDEIGYQLTSQFKSLEAALKTRESVAQAVSEAFSGVPDANTLRQNLRSDGRPTALALLALLDGDKPFSPESLDTLIQEGLKKPSGHCGAADISRLTQDVLDLVKKHREDRDPRRQLVDDIRAVVNKHKALVGQERLLEALKVIVQELQIGRL